MFPVVGAVVGGVIGGPIGLMAGMKVGSLAGGVAMAGVAGTVVGYQVDVISLPSQRFGPETIFFLSSILKRITFLFCEEKTFTAVLVCSTLFCS